VRLSIQHRLRRIAELFDQRTTFRLSANACNDAAKVCGRSRGYRALPAYPTRGLRSQAFAASNEDDAPLVRKEAMRRGWSGITRT